MSLCTCMENDKGSHEVEQIGSWDGCPLEGGGHTNFIVFRCRDCGGVCFFPEDSGKIALEKGTPETKAKLAEIINETEEKRKLVAEFVEKGAAGAAG